MRKLIVILIINNLLISWSFSQALLIGGKNQNDTLYCSKQIEYNYSFTEATKQKIFGNYNQAINLFFPALPIFKTKHFAFGQTKNP